MADASRLHAEHDLAVRLAREAGALQVRERAGVAGPSGTGHSV